MTQSRPSPTLEHAQHIVDDWIRTVGVRYFSELTNLGILMEEVGELARIMVRVYGEQSFKDSDRGKDLAEEIGDVFFVLLCLANQTGVDLTQSFFQGMEKRTRRDRRRHAENARLKNEIETDD